MDSIGVNLFYDKVLCTIKFVRLGQWFIRKTGGINEIYFIFNMILEGYDLRALGLLHICHSPKCNLNV